MQSLEGEKRMSVTEETRRESYYKTDRNTRQIEVLGAFRKYGKMTANECAKRLGYTDGNRVKPRITELKNKGLLFETGEKRYDPDTKRNGAVFDIYDKELKS